MRAAGPALWLDDTDKRGGVRDYWRFETTGGERSRLFHGRGGAVTDGRHCKGRFD